MVRESDLSALELRRILRLRASRRPKEPTLRMLPGVVQRRDALLTEDEPFDQPNVCEWNLIGTDFVDILHPDEVCEIFGFSRERLNDLRIRGVINGTYYKCEYVYDKAVISLIKQAVDGGAKLYESRLWQ